MGERGWRTWINARLVALIAGPLLAVLLIAFGDLQPGKPEVTRMAAVALWMAIWWITEAVPLAVTSLLPLALFPTLHLLSGKETAPQYCNSTIFLFIGGFIIALAMQRWNLHKRIALHIVQAIGVSPTMLLLGFMVATAFLSMWISNTATTMMMLPIALAVIFKVEETAGEQHSLGLATALLIAIAYAASIGGIATPVGTPPNLLFQRTFTITFPDAPPITFAQWMVFALPLAIVMLAIAWVYLYLVFARRTKLKGVDRSVFRQELRELGRMSAEEWQVLAVFVATALLWITSSDMVVGNFHFTGWVSRMHWKDFVDDGTVAITMATVLFLLPSWRGEGGRLLRWEDTLRLPWGIVLLFGGGFALAQGFKVSGLSDWCGHHLEGLAGMPPILVVAIVCAMMTFLTELTSNTASTGMVLPILAATAVAINVNPLLLMIPATLSASYAFMLPVGTPPNAIVFGAGRLSIAQMAKTGLVMNLIGIVITTLLVLTIGRAVLGIDLSAMPAWAVGG